MFFLVFFPLCSGVFFRACPFSFLYTFPFPLGGGPVFCRVFFSWFLGVFSVFFLCFLFGSFLVFFFVHFFVLFLVFFFRFFVPWVAPKTNNHNILHFGPCFFPCFFWWPLLVKIGYTQVI